MRRQKERYEEEKKSIVYTKNNIILSAFRAHAFTIASIEFFTQIDAITTESRQSTLYFSRVLFANAQNVNFFEVCHFNLFCLSAIHFPYLTLALTVTLLRITNWNLFEF